MVASLVEPARKPDLAPERERLPELDPDLSPRLRAPARLQHHAQDAIDAEPGVPEAGVRFAHRPCGPRGSTVSGRQRKRWVSDPPSSIPSTKEPGTEPRTFIRGFSATLAAAYRAQRDHGVSDRGTAALSGSQSRLRLCRGDDYCLRRVTSLPSRSHTISSPILLPFSYCHSAAFAPV